MVQATTNERASAHEQKEASEQQKQTNKQTKPSQRANERACQNITNKHMPRKTKQTKARQTKKTQGLEENIGDDNSARARLRIYDGDGREESKGR